MHEQTQAREQRLLQSVPDAQTAVVAVVAGEGNTALFESLGASRIVAGGQTMNPSTAELVAAIEAAPGKGVLVLPNNSNVVLAAEQAARLAAKEVAVVPTDSIQSGLAAMVAFDPARLPGENAREMEEILESLATGEVTIASRDAQLNGVAVREGEFSRSAASCTAPYG